MAEMTLLQGISTGASVLGMMQGASGSQSAAMAARRNALAVQQSREFEAQQLEQNAGQAIASGQHQAFDQRRLAQLVQSRALAVAAAGGGGASDVTVQNMIGKIAGEGAYRSAVSLYEGEDKARSMRLAAATRRMEGELAIEGGEAAAEAYKTKGMSGILSGAGSLFSKYAGSGDAALISGPGGQPWGGTVESPWYG